MVAKVSKQNQKGSMNLANVKINENEKAENNRILMDVLPEESAVSIFNLLKLPDLEKRKSNK
jgi:hypothetical protein